MRTFAQTRATFANHPAMVARPGGVDAWVNNAIRAAAERAEDAIFEQHPAGYWRGPTCAKASDQEHDVSPTRLCRP